MRCTIETTRDNVATLREENILFEFLWRIQEKKPTISQYEISIETWKRVFFNTLINEQSAIIIIWMIIAGGRFY